MLPFQWREYRQVIPRYTNSDMKEQTPLSQVAIGETVTSFDTFRQVFEKVEHGLISIRPKVIFEMIENRFETIPTIHFPIPSSQIGSVTTLEATILVALLQLRKPKVIFEFGTFLGYTTSILLLNSPTSKIFSLDLPNNLINRTLDLNDWNLIQSNDSYNDAFLTQTAQNKGELYLKSLTPSPNLQLIKEDSLNFNPTELSLMGNVDYIFLDGGHTDSVVKQDTLNASRMLSEKGILIWHDFNSNIHKKVTSVVRNIALTDVVVHIENTMLAIKFNSGDLFV